MAEEAYIFAYPMLENYKTAYFQSLRPDQKLFRFPPNRLAVASSLATDQTRDVVRPNNDTFYLLAWAELRQEPLVLTVPENTDRRYMSIQLVDMYTHVMGYIGTRTTGFGPGKFLFAGPRWRGTVPPGIDKVFRSESNLLYVLGRVGVNGEADAERAIAFQKEFKLQPLSSYLGKQAPPAPRALKLPPYDPVKAESANFISYFNFLLSQVQIHPSEREMITRWRPLGIAPGRPFDLSKLSASDRSAIEAGVKSALKKIESERVNLGKSENGWTITGRAFGSREEMQGRYLTRAAGAMFGLYGNVPEEALYPSTSTDGEGQALNGEHRYVIRFEKDQIPPVEAFWSLSMYGADQFFVPNPINRFAIGGRTEGLVYGPDGSLTLFVQAERPANPAEAANWLPAPSGPFSLTMRLYVPKPSALDPLYVPPPVRRVP